MNRPVVEDIGRPDVKGTQAKMHDIGQATQDTITGILPYVKIQTDDNLMSHVTIWATKEPQEQWCNNIFHNARYVIASITPAKGRRYYEPDIDSGVTVEVTSRGRDVPKFRKYTGPPHKAIKKLQDFLQALADQD